MSPARGGARRRARPLTVLPRSRSAPYSVMKERRIAAIPGERRPWGADVAAPSSCAHCYDVQKALRALNNKLREDARQLEAAVDDLADEVDLLGPEADR